MPRNHLAIALAAAVIISGLAQPSAAQSPSAAVRDEITATALDYIEGFYTGNAERMQRALHPQLAKRIVRVDPATGQSRLDMQNAEQLVGIARSRQGIAPPATQQKDVTILDVFGNAASVKVVANQWIDYLHVVKWNGRWVIVNVLWEMKGQG